MTILLSKGANAALPLGADGTAGHVQVVVRWAGSTAGVDVSALLLGRDDRVRSDDDLVFYNAPSAEGGAVRLLGKRVDDDGAGEDRIALDLDSIPENITAVAVAASIDGEPGVGFGSLRDLSLAIVGADGLDIARFEVSDASSETAFVLGHVYRRNDEWKCRAVGQGWDSGLAGLAADFGITIDDAPEPSAPSGISGEHEPTVIPEDAVVDAIADVIEDGPLDHDGVTEPETHPRGALPESAKGAAAAADDQLNLATPDSVATPLPGSARGPRGVQTGKRRARPAPLPPLTLAGDKSWQAARLFSVSGTGSAQEQEKRATSALLATMMVVRDFGRGLVGRFGAPGGLIETYLEVPFVLGETTVYPDGVFRVARAGKVWTGLLEVKTGANPLRREQVENYLEVAKANGFDAVISLSNDLCSVGGDHPAGVDRRKLKKVTLHHISWSEVLHEARMCLDHRGIEDREQAWVLAELIRYLQDPRSGAAGFDDMGGSWVPVREAIAAGTLRSTDKRVTEVAAAWDKLTRHMCLRLTGQLGVSVAPVLPRKVAGDAAARVQSAATQLAGEGLLSSTVRIPQAAGNLTVVADLRMGQVRTSIEVEAPREGGSSRRVNWMLRQLKDAPDNLSVEVLVARQAQSTCELLRDVRANNAALIPDPSADVRSFRLTLPSPLGAKRSGLRGAFIPGVNAAVDSFYAQVVQTIRPWTKPAAKLPGDVAEEAEETIEALDDAAEDEIAPQDL